MNQNKYFEIYQALKTAITNNLYTPGTKLPSENTLRETYNVSRNTIRRALELLAQEGVVTSVQGKGVFVMNKPPLHFLVGGLQSFSEVSDQTQIDVVTTVPVFETMTTDTDLATKTGFAVGTQLFHIIRVRTIDGIKTIVDENYFDASVLPELTIEISQTSIYDYIETTLGLKITGAQKAIAITPASIIDQTYLQVDKKQLIAIVSNTVYLDSGQQFEYTQSRHLPERFTFNTYARR